MTPDPSVLHISCLDSRLRVATDRPGLLEALGAHLGAFTGDQIPGDPPGSWVEIRFDPPPPRALTPRMEVALDQEAALGQAYGLVFRELLDGVEGFFMLHAGAVESRGRAYLLAGPSGSGKTTLTLALVKAGLKLLSDDFAPLERKTRLVHRFPKSLGVRPGPGLLLADRLSASPQVEEPRSLPPSVWAEGPRPLGGLVLFDGGPIPSSPWTPYAWAIDVAGDPLTAAGFFEGLAGVERLAIEESRLVLKIDPERASARALEQALAAAAGRILQYGSVGWGPPPPGRPPALLPLGGSDTILLLLRELQNRRPEGRLVRSLGGDLAALAAELAGLLSIVPCVWLVPGEPEATAALLVDLFGGNPAVAGTLPGSWSR